jgi:hypothetical protein
MMTSVPDVDCSIELFPKGSMFTNTFLLPANIASLATGKNCHESLPSFCVIFLSTLYGIQFLSTKYAYF